MASGQLHPVLRILRRLVAAESGGDSTDRHLLQRFAGQREEAAFAALVGRHGPKVLGVCLRVLHDPHDADDAFQATFLVLARKAGSLARPEKLANWLYGVACRTAARRRQKRPGGGCTKGSSHTCRPQKRDPTAPSPVTNCGPCWTRS